MTSGLMTAPSADAAIAIDVNVNPAYTAGFIASVLNFVGNTFPGLSLGGAYNSGPPQTVGLTLDPIPYDFVTGVGVIRLNLDVAAQLFLKNLKPTDTQSLYNTLAAIPQQNTGCGGTVVLQGDSNPATSCRFAFMLGTSGATLRLANAYQAEIASVQGTTEAGYIPFQATTGSTAAKPTQTNQVLAFLQNPLRPNGGILSRFPGLSERFGQNPAMPGAGLYKSPDQKITINTSTLDVTWAYDPTADFPVASNIFSILNSLNAFLPINLAGGLNPTHPFVFADSNGAPVELKDFGLNLAALFQVKVSPVPVINNYWLKMVNGTASYVTIVPDQLPLLTPNRLPALAVNALLGAINAPFRFGTPFADAIEPAMKILVNVGYDDVLAPDKLNTCATACDTADAKTWAELGYQAYDRTYLKAGSGATVGELTLPYTPFGSVDPLTPAERAEVPNDVVEALFAGFRTQLSKPLFGIIVPANSGASSAAAKAARVATPAAAEVTDAPTVDEPAPVEVTDIGTPMPSLLSGGPVAAPKQGSLRASRGKSEGQSAASRIRRPAAASVAGGNDVVKPAAAGKSAVTR